MSGYHTIAVEPVTPAIGAVVTGVDLHQTLGFDQISDLQSALAEHLVLFFRDQDLDDAQHLAFASRFGRPNVFPATRARGLDAPLEWIEDSLDSPPKTDLWHTDVAFLGQPPDVAVINMRETPPVGGDTVWTSLYAVHDALSPLLQEFVAGLELDVHPGPDFKAKVELQFGPGIYEKVAEDFAGARHPLVRLHPVTGRRALYLCGRYVRGIVGLHSDESDVLLDLLYRGLDNPNFQCRWRWKRYDVALWDERCTNHRALSDHYPSRRVIRRCTVGAATPAGPATPSTPGATLP